MSRMDKNEIRDTHFQGFAKLLFQELYGVDDYFEYPVPLLIIARRAYDLVYHTILNVDCYDLVMLPYEEIPPRIPDLVPDITLDGKPYPKPPKP